MKIVKVWEIVDLQRKLNILIWGFGGKEDILYSMDGVTDEAARNQTNTLLTTRKDIREGALLSVMS